MCAAERDTAACFDFASVWQAWLACRKRKRSSSQAQRYELALLDHIEHTASALRTRCYTPARSTCFVARKPKAREIHAAAFSDRVVHHLLVPRLEVLYEPVFIYDLYSNRKNKGTHAAVDRLQTFMRSLTGDGQAAYFLQLDIRNFFNTIDRRRLFDLLQQRIEQKIPKGQERSALLWLTRLLLTGNPAHTAICKGSADDFARVPPYKRLSRAPAEKGLPIGNLTSQFFANVYLNELDQFVKHQLKCRHYLRYVDDFILLHHHPDQLRQWRDAIEQFLWQRLELCLKEHPEPRRVTSGADFLGYIVRPHYRLVRRRVVGNLYEKLNGFESRLRVSADTYRLSSADREALRSTLASYLGHFCHANSHRLIRSLWQRYRWLQSLFDWNGAKLIPRWEPPSVSSLRSQWRYFCRQWPQAWVLIQVGGRLQLFNHQAEAIKGCLGIPVDQHCRIGFTASVSIPFQRHGRFLKRLRRLGQVYCLVLEEGYLKGGLKRRVLRGWFQPC